MKYGRKKRKKDDMTFTDVVEIVFYDQLSWYSSAEIESIVRKKSYFNSIRCTE